MIAVDTSALSAIAFRESDAGDFIRELSSAKRMCMSAGTAVEMHLVIGRRGGDLLVHEMNQLLDEFEVELVDVDAEQVELARRAFGQFGKGNGHPAHLDFGDLFAYALAKARNIPLLYKGSDFARTDIASALDR